VVRLGAALENRANGENKVLRHVVLLRWKSGISDADLQSIRDSLAELPAAIPEIRRYVYGDDAGLAEGNFDFAIVADFETQLDYQNYATHEDHQRVIAEQIRPVLDARAALQYEISDGGSFGDRQRD
jgi:hypothetical protein